MPLDNLDFLRAVVDDALLVEYALHKADGRSADAMHHAEKFMRELDVITPVSAFCALLHKLVECGVPAINILYPLTQHAFDLLLPQVSPPAQAALYEVERFLALIAAGQFQERAHSALPAEAISTVGSDLVHHSPRYLAPKAGQSGSP